MRVVTTLLLSATLLSLVACGSSMMAVGTRTIVGVGLTASSTTGEGSIALGYTREELAIIPLTEAGEPPPDLYVALGYQLGVPSLTNLQATIRQVLATGTAAEVAATRATHRMPDAGNHMRAGDSDDG